MFADKLKILKELDEEMNVQRLQIEKKNCVLHRKGTLIQEFFVLNTKTIEIVCYNVDLFIPITYDANFILQIERN